MYISKLLWPLFNLLLQDGTFQLPTLVFLCPIIDTRQVIQTRDMRYTSHGFTVHLRYFLPHVDAEPPGLEILRTHWAHFWRVILIFDQLESLDSNGWQKHLCMTVKHLVSLYYA